MAQWNAEQCQGRGDAHLPCPLQSSGKLEKAEILEMTVQYLRALHSADFPRGREKGRWAGATSRGLLRVTRGVGAAFPAPLPARP